MDTPTFTFKVTVNHTSRNDMFTFLDMLRYDRATVFDWSYGPGEAVTVTLTGPRYTPDRWLSFGFRTERVWR